MLFKNMKWYADDDIEEEVEHTLLVATETIPFDIQVKVESLV